MKVGVIFYHKNIKDLYQWSWIEKSVYSIINQSYNDFEIFEVNYGNENFSILNELKIKRNYSFYNRNYNNHADAMNFLIEEALRNDVDILFNTNLDDYYDIDRFKIQIEKINQGFDVVASNFTHVDDNDNFIRNMQMCSLDIKSELNNQHNLIAHPVVCWSKKFLKKNRYISSEIPAEDLRLWQRTYKKYNFTICSEYLLNYRIHNKQITKSTSEQLIVNQTPQYNLQLQNRQYVDRCISCGEIKNKMLYNFCQKCNKLY